MLKKYRWVIIGGISFLYFLKAIQNKETADIIVFSFLISYMVFPLYLFGKIGANMTVGICEIVSEFLCNNLREPYRIKFSKIQLPVFIYEFIKACVHCFFAVVIANTDFYLSLMSDLIYDNTLTMESGVKPILILYITYYMAYYSIRFSIMRFGKGKEAKTENVQPVN